jgi:hypothetical protein
VRIFARVLLVLTLAGAGTACGGGSSKSTGPSSPAAAGSSSTAALTTETPALPATAPDSPTALAAFLQRGFATFGSARIAFSTALSGNALAGGGSVRLGAGQVSGLDVTATVSKIGRVHYVLAGAGAYAALPKPVAGKPYVLLGGSQTSDQLTRAAIGLQATKLLASPATYRTLVLAAPSLPLIDRLGVAGVPALHYRGPVPVDRIPSSDPVRIALGALGVDNLALDLWVDGAGRPIKASAPAEGRASDVSFSAINRPVTLAAPPADQVAS